MSFMGVPDGGFQTAFVPVWVRMPSANGFFGRPVFSDALQHGDGLVDVVLQGRIISQSLHRVGDFVAALLFECGRLGDGLGQCFGAVAREEKACFIVHDFGTGHVVGEDDARAAQDGFDADQSERFVQGRHDGEIGGAVEFGHVCAETQPDDVFHGARQRRTGDGEFDGQVGVFEKVRQQIESFALVAGRGEQEHGFVVPKAVFRADGGGFFGSGIEAGGIGGRMDDADFFGRHAVERGQFALHQVRMCHDGFGRRVVAAVAADGEAVEQAGPFAHVVQIA